MIVVNRGSSALMAARIPFPLALGLGFGIGFGSGLGLEVGSGLGFRFGFGFRFKLGLGLGFRFGSGVWYARLSMTATHAGIEQGSATIATDLELLHHRLFHGLCLCLGSP